MEAERCNEINGYFCRKVKNDNKQTTPSKDKIISFNKSLIILIECINNV